MTARSTSRSRACCCCPCGLAPVVTVAAGTTWGDATPCYASHHMMLVLLYGLAHNTYPTLKPRLVFSTLKPRLAEHPHTQTDRFFFLDVAIRNSLCSNNKITFSLAARQQLCNQKATCAQNAWDGDAQRGCPGEPDKKASFETLN